MSRPGRVSLAGRCAETVAREGMLPRGSRVLVAVSGGADSVCLLELLRVLAPRLELVLSGFHLNHRLRPVAAEDEAFARELFERDGLALVVGRADVRGFARRHRLGIEEAGRELRYRHLSRQARRLGCDRVALGHTADDNLETMILNLLRGAGTAGLRGIPAVRGIFVRPLIDLGRQDIEDWLRARGAGWREDESNADERFARNLVRRRVVPALRELNPDPAAAGRRAARLLADEDDCLDRLAGEALARSALRARSGTEIDVAALLAYNVCLRRRMVRKLIPGLDSGGVERALAFLAGRSRRLASAAGCVLTRQQSGRVRLEFNQKGIHGR
ncbi:MAG: tRNA lysidine(34) synthetase TilS [bacterium]